MVYQNGHVRYLACCCTLHINSLSQKLWDSELMWTWNLQLCICVVSHNAYPYCIRPWLCAWRHKLEKLLLEGTIQVSVLLFHPYALVRWLQFVWGTTCTLTNLQYFGTQHGSPSLPPDRLRMFVWSVTNDLLTSPSTYSAGQRKQSNWCKTKPNFTSVRYVVLVHVHYSNTTKRIMKKYE